MLRPRSLQSTCTSEEPDRGQHQRTSVTATLEGICSGESSNIIKILFAVFLVVRPLVVLLGHMVSSLRIVGIDDWSPFATCALRSRAVLRDLEGACIWISNIFEMMS